MNERDKGKRRKDREKRVCEALVSSGSLFLSVLFFSVSEGFMPLPGRKAGRGAAETGSLMWHGGKQGRGTEAGAWVTEGEPQGESRLQQSPTPFYFIYIISSLGYPFPTSSSHLNGHLNMLVRKNKQPFTVCICINTNNKVIDCTNPSFFVPKEKHQMLLRTTKDGFLSALCCVDYCSDRVVGPLLTEREQAGV